MTDITTMNYRTAVKSFISFISVMILSSCSHYETDGIHDRSGSLICSAAVADIAATKSRITCAEDYLSEAAMAVYNAAGYLVKAVYTSDLQSVEIPHLHIGETYRIYAAFNAGNPVFPILESDIGTLPMTWNSSDVNAGGFPMTWSGTVVLVSDGQSLVMDATRLVSKVRFGVNNTSLTGHNGAFTVSSIALRNSVETMPLFADSQHPSGEAGYSSDSAVSSDITSVNAGGKISFYALENLGGTLLPGNTDPWGKVPSGIGPNADRCTYLEVNGTYSTDGGTCTAPVTYRMYLGEDITTNFDLVRNCVYDVMLTPSDGGVDSVSWRISRGTFSDSRSLSFTPPSINMYVNTDAVFKVNLFPSDMICSLAEGEGFGRSTLTLIASNSANEYTLVSSGTLPSDITTSVTATSWDGRVTAVLPVTVKAKMLTKAEIILDGTSGRNYVRGTDSATLSGRLTYSDGSTVTSGFSFSLTGDAASLSGTTLTGVSTTFGNTSEVHRADKDGRSVQIAMSYQGVQMSTLKVYIMPSFSLSASMNGSLMVGGTQTFNARLKVTNYYDGSEVTPGYVAVGRETTCGATVYRQDLMSFEGKGTATLRGLKAGGPGTVGVYWDDRVGVRFTAPDMQITVGN